MPKPSFRRHQHQQQRQPQHTKSHSSSTNKLRLILLLVGFVILGVGLSRSKSQLAGALQMITKSALAIQQEQEPSFAVVIVHCKEDQNKTAWYSQIPSAWKVTIYETCQQMVSPTLSVPFQNAGSEECTAYLDYVLKNRESLADITIFLQTDTFRGYTNKNKLNPNLSFQLTAHSPFTHFDQLVQATKAAMVQGNQQFLHYGWGMLNFDTEWGANVSDAANEVYVEHYLKEMWAIFAKAEDSQGNYINPYHSFQDKLQTRPGAIFAVSKQRILANPPSVYQQLTDKIMEPPELPVNPNNIHTPARRRCCSLENTWHVLFHEAPRLPKASTVDHLYEGYRDWEY